MAAGGVVFTTIQKFTPEAKGDSYPLLSDRRNIVVIADEAHRSQYDFIDGFARHLRDAVPKASFIGFTGTPIEGDDVRLVLGGILLVLSRHTDVLGGADQLARRFVAVRCLEGDVHVGLLCGLVRGLCGRCRACPVLPLFWTTPMANRRQTPGSLRAALQIVEHEGIMTRDAAVDHGSQVRHAGRDELPPEHFYRALHGCVGLAVVPYPIAQALVGKELIGAAGQPCQKPERHGIAETAGAAGPPNAERGLVNDRRAGMAVSRVGRGPVVAGRMWDGRIDGYIWKVIENAGATE